MPKSKRHLRRRLTLRARATHLAHVYTASWVFNGTSSYREGPKRVVLRRLSGRLMRRKP